MMRALADAGRLLRTEPGFVGGVSLLLALGIGANVAIFAAAYAVILRPLPFADQDALVLMWERDRRRDVVLHEVSYPDYLDWRAQNRSFTDLAAIGSTNWTVRLALADGPVSLPYAAVSGSFFHVLGVRPALGAAFTDAHDRRGAGRVAVISHSTWQTYFAGDPNIVGRTMPVVLDGVTHPYTILGVAPADFDFHRGAAMWLPLAPALGGASAESGFDTLAARDLGVLYVVGRLRPGATMESAQADLDAIVGRLTGGADVTRGRTAVLTSLPQYVLGPTQRALLLLLCAAGVVFVLTCSNVIALLLTRLAARRRQLAIRVALGAGRRQFLAQSLTESTLLAACGAAGAVALAAWGLPLLTALVPDSVPRLHEADALDPRTVMFTAAIALVAAVVCGVVPVLLSLRGDGLNVLSMALLSRTPPFGLRHSIVIGQVALCVVLLIAAVLTYRSFRAIQDVDLGFEPAGVYTFNVRPPEDKYSKPEVNRRLYRPVLERVSRVPGIVSAGGVYLRPFELGPIGSDVAIVLEGQSPQNPADYRVNPGLNSEAVTPGYFEAMRIPLRRGRLFTERDDETAPRVVIVSESAARRLWPGRDAIGRKLFASYDNRDQWQTVVGVVADVRYRGVIDPRFDLYKPYLQSQDGVQHLMIRTDGRASITLDRLRSEIRAIEPGAVVDGLRPIGEMVDREYAPWRFTALLFALLGALGMSVAVIGLYAVVSAHVAERTREIGIRIALGARRAQMMRWIAGRVALLVGMGLAAGLAAALLASRSIGGLLFGVTATDAGAYVTVCALLAASAGIAVLRPATRAANVDPLVALKQE